MDIATLLGFVTGFGLMLYAIMDGAGLGAFFDFQSVLIVIGGTLGATLVTFPLGQVIGAGSVAKKAFMYKLIDPKEVIKQMADFSNRARREGILALEEAAGAIDNPFLKKGIQLAVDGEDPQAIENILDTEISYLKDRHKNGSEVFATMAALAPSLGLVGTLIGLVGMLKNMDDPSTIGPSMAVALITTFYGAVLANMVFSPLASKLERNSSQEALVSTLYLMGAASIGRQENPRRLEMLLNSILPPSKRIQYFD